MGTTGIVRFWLDEDGWGVIDSDQTPGGCWAHNSCVAVAGYRSLAPGQQVRLEWEAANQDGYAFRATRTWPLGQEPIQDSPAQVPDGIYTSTLTITFDDE
jgi:CspA family cold shock protein